MSMPIDVQKPMRDLLLQMFKTLREQLILLLSTKKASVDFASAVEMTDPSSQPHVWVNKWVDYSDRYGFGYLMSDGGIGAMFDDGTRLLLLADKFSLHYINRFGNENHYTVVDYPVGQLKSKVLFMGFINRFLNQRYLRAAALEAVQRESMHMIPIYINQWFIPKANTILMQLSNGSVQINFPDHTKIILCPVMAAVTYIDEEKIFRTYRFETIQKNGCVPRLAANLQEAFHLIGAMLPI